MATVTTSLALSARLQNFDVPGTLPADSNPFAVAEFIGSVIVPLKDALDDSVVTVVQTLPKNFIFKIATINVHYTCAESADLLDLVRLITPGTIGQGVGGLNQNLMLEIANGQTPVKRQLTGQDFIALGHPVGDYQLPIRTGIFSGDETLTWQWVDNSSDDTLAITIFFRMRMLMYTVAQFRNFPMFNAVPTIGV